MAISYRDLIIKSVVQPNQGIRRIQTGVATLTGGTTTIPISSLLSPSSKVYLLTSHLDENRDAGSQGYTAVLQHTQSQIEIKVSGGSFAGSVSWQIIEVY